MDKIVGEFYGTDAFAIPSHYSKTDQYNVTQHILSTRKTWPYLSNHFRNFIRTQIPQYINLYADYNPETDRKKLERNISQYIACSIARPQPYTNSLREKMPISGKDMCKLFLKAGYEIVPGGKGSHMKLKKKNCPTVIIPGHRELKKGLEHSLRKLLESVK